MANNKLPSKPPTLKGVRVMIYACSPNLLCVGGGDLYFHNLRASYSESLSQSVVPFLSPLLLLLSDSVSQMCLYSAVRESRSSPSTTHRHTSPSTTSPAAASQTRSAQMSSGGSLCEIYVLGIMPLNRHPPPPSSSVYRIQRKGSIIMLH